MSLEVRGRLDFSRPSDGPGSNSGVDLNATIVARFDIGTLTKERHPTPQADWTSVP